MNHYDPEIQPDSTAWLALSEQERIDLVEEYHRKARIELPNIRVHAVFHAIIENQIAEGLESVIRAMARVAKEGLSRHDAIHAISAVCAEHLFDIMKSNDQEGTDKTHARYDAAVERLTAKSWRKHYGAK